MSEKREQKEPQAHSAERETNVGRNVPKLRFPGFEGEWEMINVADLLDFFPTNSLSWEQLEYNRDSLRNLHYGLIHNGLPTQVNLNECELPSIKHDYKPKQYTLCKKGDVAFADASEDTNDVGKVIEFIDCADKSIVCGLHTIHGRDKLHKTIPGFKGYAFSSKAFHDQIKRIAQGTKIFSISTGNFEEVSIGIPNKVEQSKIATLLSLIDQRISIQSKIINRLKMTELQIRERIFKGLSSPCISLSSICTRIKARNNELNNNVLSISARDGLISQLDFFNKSVASENLSNYYLLYRGDFAYNKSYSSDHPWGAIKHLERYEKGVLSPLYFCFRVDMQLVNTEYLQNFFETSLWHKYIAEIAVEGARNHGLLNMSVEDFFSIPIPLPSIEEQQAIAERLSVVQRKRVIEESYYKSLQSQRQFFLKNLFI